jgi:nanoRNase/pAp phosphatase (c-di-AMP/oligoRNAs hydrolase)
MKKRRERKRKRMMKLAQEGGGVDKGHGWAAGAQLYVLSRLPALVEVELGRGHCRLPSPVPSQFR